MRFLAAAVAVVALTSAGCGGGSSHPASNGEASKPANRVLADALKAANAASSVHMAGYTQLNTGHRLVVDVTFAKGKGATGTITTDGRKANVVVLFGTWNDPECVGCTLYVRGSAAFWAHWPVGAGSSHARALSGKWIELSSPHYFAPYDLYFFYALTNFSGNIGTFGLDQGGLTKQTTTYDGQSVIALNALSGPRSALVAATGTPYPVHAAIKDRFPISMSYGDWNKPASITAPSNAIEFSKLGG